MYVIYKIFSLSAFTRLLQFQRILFCISSFNTVYANAVACSMNTFYFLKPFIFFNYEEHFHEKVYEI
jgi:hypothetical protein